MKCLEKTSPTCTIVVVGAPPANLDCGFCGSGHGKVGSPFSAALAVTGGAGPLTYSIVSGSLPPGLTLNSFTGVISGSPMVTGGTYTFTSKVVDSAGNSDTVVCTITVSSY